MDSQDPNARVTSFKGTVKQSNVGLVTCIDEKDLHEIQTALNTEPEPIKAAGLQAPVEFIDAFAQTLPPGTPYEYLLRLLTTKSVIHPRFFMCNHKDLTTVAACLDNVKGLSVFQRHVFTAAPSDAKADVGVNVLKALAKCVAKRKAVTIVDVPELPLDILELPPSGDRQYLLELELLHKSLILYLWLSYRFSNIFLDREMAIHAKEMCEEKINTTLLEFSANPKLRRRLLEMRHIEYKKDASNKSHENSDGTISEEPVAEEDLTESLNDLSALPIDWEHGNSGDHLNADAGALEIRQREAARP